MTRIAATLIIRERLRQRLLPPHESWRCPGEYAGECLRNGCGARSASAQTSYGVDFPPGVTPQSVKTHRACSKIRQYEGGSPRLSPNASERRNRKE